MKEKVIYNLTKYILKYLATTNTRKEFLEKYMKHISYIDMGYYDIINTETKAYLTKMEITEQEFCEWMGIRND